MPEPFTKSRRGPDAARFLATQAAGLAWISVPGGPPVPTVRSVTATALVLDRVEQGPATARAAEDLGRRLARLHGAGAPAFGSPPPGAPGPGGWIGDLPMPYAREDSFAVFWAVQRLAPAARAARDSGGLSPAQTSQVDRFCGEIVDGQVDCGPPSVAARVHGDLWSGNVVWGTDGRAWVIDPAAHGGHPESDLAMLALFGAPHLDVIQSGYEQVSPLADGWRDRAPLHQTWPLLVHAALFGGGYASAALGAIRRARA